MNAMLWLGWLRERWGRTSLLIFELYDPHPSKHTPHARKGNDEIKPGRAT